MREKEREKGWSGCAAGLAEEQGEELSLSHLGLGRRALMMAVAMLTVEGGREAATAAVQASTPDDVQLQAWSWGSFQGACPLWMGRGRSPVPDLPISMGPGLTWSAVKVEKKNVQEQS